MKDLLGKMLCFFGAHDWQENTLMFDWTTAPVIRCWRCGRERRF